MDASGGAASQATIRVALQGQYHAALAMLREAIERCPDALWLDETPRNAFWRVAYHTLFFTHLYLLDRSEDFVPWEGHQDGFRDGDGLVRPAEPGQPAEAGPRPYLKAEVLAYWAVCDAMVDERLGAMNLASPDSGFSWYPISKLEHQIVNIRHIAHHASQLADRVRAAGDIRLKWVGTGHGRPPDA
ncbi:MAG: DinB family protein [Vicinamibacterales bacterium]